MAGFHGGYSAAEAWFYDRYIAPATLAATQALEDRIADAAPRGGAVLDVGCGGGQQLVALQARRPDLRLIGVEPSRVLRGRARRRLAPTGTAQVLAGTAEALPVRTGAFDVVVSLFAIKHWRDQGRGLAECTRVLRPGGRLIIAELDARAQWKDWTSLVGLSALPRPVRPAYAAATLRAFVRRGASADRLAVMLTRQGLQLNEAGGLPRLAIAYAVATASDRPAGLPRGPARGPDQVPVASQWPPGCRRGRGWRGYQPVRRTG